MKKLFTLIVLLGILGFSQSFAQTNVYLKINHKLGANAFAFNTSATNSMFQEFNVTRLQYYIAEVTLIHDGGTETIVPNFWILANASTTVNEMLGSYNITTLEGVRFGIGVESAVNHLDPSQYASNHPLAPKSPSMHWGWTAGYRFVAIEGKAGSGMTTTWQIHALEDPNYYTTTVSTAGVTNGSDLIIDLDADYVRALDNINVSSGPITHGGFGEAVTLLRNFRDYVFSEAGTATAVSDLLKDNFSMTVYPNPAQSTSWVSIENGVNGELVITDLAGRTLKKYTCSANSLTKIEGLPSGMYLVSLVKDGENLSVKKLSIQ